MLKDLRLPGKGLGVNSATSIKENVARKIGHEKRLIAAFGIIDDIFQEVNDSVQHDRSNVKLNMFEKGVIGGMLNERVKNGIKKYMYNMDERDVENMINKIKNRVRDV